MRENPYVMTNWVDHIIDMELGEIIQEGTRFTASRANNIEEGIFNLYDWIIFYRDDLAKLRLQLEMLGRVPVNNGTFFDPLGGDEESKALTLLKSYAVVQNILAPGTLQINVNVTTGFAVNDYITIYDDVNTETTKITNITGSKITVSALTKNYKKGALIERSNARLLDSKLQFGEWGNYKITVTEGN